MAEHFVVVGAGQAAVQAAQTARQAGFTGPITLLGEEPWLPYQRPPLSKKYLAGQLTRDRLELKPASFYSSRDIELVTSMRVEELELARRRLRLADGRKLSYDRLLLATGSRPRRLDVPGTDLDGVHYLRTIADVDALAPRLEPGARLVIVGGGYIGLEVAAVATRLGLDVTLLETAERILARVVCRETAEFFARYHRNAGVALHCGAAVSGFRGTRGVEAVETEAGERYPCDLAIIAIGIVPNVELAERAGLACANGIRVDAFGRTGDARVFAAGDCTSQRHPGFAAEIRLESVHNALEQGKAAGLAAAGQATAFDEVPWFWSDQYDLKLQIAGLALAYDRVALRGDPESASFAVYYLDAGRVVAVDAINRPRDFLAAKKLVARRATVPVEAIENPELDLGAALT